jgi:hypothetical protein
MEKIVVLLLVTLVVIVALLTTQRSYYSDKHPILDKVRENFVRIDPKFGDIPLRYGNSSYTEKKSVITLCLAKPENGEFYDMNTIMYVALHELAHIITKSKGHGDEFKANFINLLRRAAQLGIYDPNKPIPTSYCGVSA